MGALAVLFVAMPFTRGVASAADFAWGAAAGLCGAAGATLIYKSLALGPAVVASPVFSLVGVIVPVLFGLAIGERPSARAWGGVALAMVAIPLLALTREHAGRYTREHVRRTLRVALAAGLVVGWFLICVARIGGDAGMWPLVLARIVSMTALAAWLVIAARPLVPPAAARAPALGAGALDSAANVAYWIAVQSAPIALVAPLVSLAPATTVLLARVGLGERTTAAQLAGLAVALVAGALISLG